MERSDVSYSEASANLTPTASLCEAKRRIDKDNISHSHKCGYAGNNLCADIGI
jgi:hypothetical protein